MPPRHPRIRSMGINVYVQTLEHEHHPEWDTGRFSGDRELPDILSALPHAQATLGDERDCEFVYRPADVETFRAAMLARFDWNHERWNQLADLLMDDRWWIYFSY